MALYHLGLEGIDAHGLAYLNQAKHDCFAYICVRVRHLVRKSFRQGEQVVDLLVAESLAVAQLSVNHFYLVFSHAEDGLKSRRFLFADKVAYRASCEV